MSAPLDRHATDTAAVLARQERDTNRSFAAFCDYAAMGPERSLEKLVQMWAGSGPTKWLSTLKRWSTDGQWVARVQEYDAAQQEAERQVLEAERLRRRRRLEQQDWEDGQALRTAVNSYVRDLPQWLHRRETTQEVNGEKIKIIMLALGVGPGELARALETASKIQRLAVGEPTEITQAVERELEAFLDRCQQNLEPEIFARIVALAAGPAPPGE